MIALMACSGCHLWNTDALPFGNSLSAEMLGAMRQQLDRDAWQPNHDWSLLEIDFGDLANEESEHASRWTFGNPVLDNAISQLDTAQPDRTPTKNAAEKGEFKTTDSAANGLAETAKEGTDNTASPDPRHWDGFWPLEVEQVLDSLDADPQPTSNHSVAAGLGTRYLKQLARENTISGWNAAIFLAQRDPVAARAFLPVLENIVSAYPKHPKKTGKDRVQPDLADGEALTQTEPDSSATNDTNETIDAFVERIAQQLNAKLDLADETTAKTDDEEKPKPLSQQAKLFENFRKRVNSVSPLKNADEKPNEMERLSDSMRAAAAEAWCLALASNAADPLEQLAPAGRMLERADLPNRVRGELYRSVAGYIAPSRIPRMSNALRISEKSRRVPLEVRHAVVESCLIYALAQWRRRVKSSTSTRRQLASALPYDRSLWPDTISNCRSDTDGKVRRTFGRWAAVVNYRGRVTDASAILESQMRDPKANVHLDALESLGWLGTPAARETLREQAERSEGVVRAAAVAGLSRWGIDELVRFADDQSSPVRQVVATKLVQHPSTRSYFLMQKLIGDRDLQVQAAVVTGIEDWPDDPALTLLLVALRDSSGPTRRLAFQQLRRRRMIRDVFSAFDSPRREERQRAVADLGTRLDIPLHFSDHIAVETFGSRRTPDTLFVRDVESLLQVVTVAGHSSGSSRRAEAVSRLMQLQPDDVPIIEEFLLKQTADDTGFVYRELLPRLSPAHAALNEMEHPDLQRRRRAARQLREVAAGMSLSRLVVRRLLLKLDERQDTLIWHDAMAAVMPDATDYHAQVALKALNDKRADIRFLGCEYILRHPRRRFANWLQQLRLFGDPDQRVRLAAIKAAGRCENSVVLDDRVDNTDSSEKRPNDAKRFPGLRSLMTNSNAELRMAAAISMAHLGDRQGTQELSRLSWSSESRIRLEAVRAMGETASTWFIEPLIRHGWTERHVDVRLAILNSLNQLTLPGKRPANLVDENGYDAKIKTWLKWLETGHQTRITRRVES